MLVNETTAISSSSVLLVPYSKHHVPRYHEWMKDEEIQEATASEPLTLEEEYAMQESWRKDADKLTFITCLPLPLSASGSTPATTDREEKTISIKEVYDTPHRMVGDVNLFLRIDDEDESAPKIAGELELMVAEKSNQRQGFGRSSLLCFLQYIANHQSEIVAEFLRSNPLPSPSSSTQQPDQAGPRLSFLSVKIGQNNARSLALFDSLAFRRQSKEPNYFGEFELRRSLDADDVRTLLEKFSVTGYAEQTYC